MLYAMDLSGGAEPEPSLADTRESFDLRVEAEGDSFAEGIVDNAREHMAEIDEEVQSASKNWRLERMSTVDRNILRLAAAELMYDESVPTKVVINEAIELAKRFGTTESPAFVNGILDRVAAKVREQK
ncbi:MAG: transcription antitermination factor NusB [Myxococcales bacterium]|nr:transcription antitermination factor NusB [Myxococcales bacterium]